MRIALQDLRLDHLTVLYPGNRAYTLDERVSVLPVTAIAEDAAALLRVPSLSRRRER